MYMEYIHVTHSWCNNTAPMVHINMCKKFVAYVENIDWYPKWRYFFRSVTSVIIAWLSITKYMCHKWPRIYSVCRSNDIGPLLLNELLPICLIFPRSNTTGATSVAGFELDFVTESLIFCVAFCAPSFVYLSFLFRARYCCSFCDTRFLITQVVRASALT